MFSHDAVTGLPTTAVLRDRFHQARATARRDGGLAWLAYVDIDHFKFVNDILDHRAGDFVLGRMAERLLFAVQESDTVARIGGDEFVLLMGDGASETLTQATLERIMDAVAQAIVIEGQQFLLTCSIGIAVYPDDSTDIDTLIKQAGIAMARAKEMGGHCFQFYAPGMHQRTMEHARLAADMHHALEHDEFVLHYQPQVDLRTGCVVGVEALLRWQHPEMGMLFPARFIELAEELDLIVPLGAWVLRSACRQNKQWQDAGHRHLRVAVNLSARQFYQADLAESIIAVLAETGLSPFDLEIELTESLVMNDVETAIGMLNRLKAIGVHIAIDDFGTGYSSLSYLKRFPIDVLKIDQSFVRNMTVDADDAQIVSSIVSLAHNLRLEVIAEGVETAAQVAFLRRRACDQMQGFYFSRAVPAGEFEAILQRQTCLWAPRAASPARQQTLLIVDDEVNVTAALSRLLRKENFNIVVAQTALAGFDALAIHDVQVILCDQRMPSMTGVEFFCKVRDMYPDTMRVMLTGFAEPGAIIDAINRGAVHRFFTKPWQDEVLRDSLRDIFRQYWQQHGGERGADGAALVTESLAG